MQIENNTVYDVDTISEGSKVLTRRYRIIVVASEGAFLAMLLYLLIRHGLNAGWATYMIPVVGMVLVAIIGMTRLGSYKKGIMQRLKVVNHQDKVPIKYLIDEEKITIETANGSNSLFMKDIKKVSELKNLYVVVYLGGVFSIIAKSGFTGDGEQEFRKIMGNRIKA